ncbi:MAG: hypothetical protein HRU11_05165 [Parvularculaceae bacterium]|nr:hypothetical protein [Parvularculaceae bacterium]
MLISLLLSTHPLVDAVRSAPDVAPATCPFRVEMMTRNGEELETAWLLVDPQTKEVTRLDADGEPLANEDAEALDSGEDASEDEGQSVNVGAFDYAMALSRLDLPLQEQSFEGGKLVLWTDDLPKGTVDMNGKDMSKKSSVTIVLQDGDAGPHLSEYWERLEKPVRMKMVARVKTYERKVKFSRVGDTILPTADDMSVSLSAMGNNMSFGFAMAYTYLPCKAEAEG